MPVKEKAENLASSETVILSHQLGSAKSSRTETQKRPSGPVHTQPRGTAGTYSAGRGTGPVSLPASPRLLPAAVSPPGTGTEAASPLGPPRDLRDKRPHPGGTLGGSSAQPRPGHPPAEGTPPARSSTALTLLKIRGDNHTTYACSQVSARAVILLSPLKDG